MESLGYTGKQAEDGELPFWASEDETLLRKYGGSIKFHECLLEQMKRRLEQQLPTTTSSSTPTTTTSTSDEAQLYSQSVTPPTAE